MKRIYAIPGLGTTAALYNFIKVKDVKLKVINWPEFSKDETMQTYAAKIATQIDDSEPFYLMGVSYGGMLCTEISLIKDPVKTILISSCENSKEFPWTLRFFQYFPIHKLVTDKMFRSMARSAKWVLGFRNEYKSDFYKMVTEMPSGYFKSSINSIVGWKRQGGAKNSVRIHGDKDKLLWYSALKKNIDHTISGGSHSMVLDKAEEINRILEQIIK